MACPTMSPAKTTASRFARLLGTKEEDARFSGEAVVVAIAFFLDLRLIPVPDLPGSDHERHTRSPQQQSNSTRSACRKTCDLVPGTLDLSSARFHGRGGALRRPSASICEVNGRSPTPQRGGPTMGLKRFYNPEPTYSAE